MRYQSKRHLLIKDLVPHLLLLPLLVGNNHGLPPLVSQQHRSTRVLDEIIWLQLPAVDQRQDEPVNHRGAKFFNQIQRECRVPRLSTCRYPTWGSSPTPSTAETQS